MALDVSFVESSAVLIRGINRCACFGVGSYIPAESAPVSCSSASSGARGAA